MRIVSKAAVAAPPLQADESDLLKIERPPVFREIDSLTAYLARFMAEDRAERWAERLVRRYGSLAEVWGVPHRELRRFGVPEPVLEDFAASVQFWQELQWSRLRDRPIVRLWPQLREFLRITMRNLPDRQYRVLFLDSQARLKWDEVLFQGYENHITVYPREVAKRCLELRSTSIVTVRNCPDRNALLPYRENLEDALLAETLALLDIHVRNRVLVAGDDVRQLRTFSRRGAATVPDVVA